MKRYGYAQKQSAKEIESLNDFQVLLQIASITVFLIYQKV